jgi:3-oxoacyl-[acyl-carrier protein] reductase
MFSLSEKIAIVTGGSRGIGRAVCEALAAQGAHVVVCYVRGEDKAKAVAASITANGGSAEIAGFDVSDMAAAEAAVKAIAKRHGRLDILVANAGISIDALLLRTSEEALDKQIAVNLKGAIACAKAATRAMMRKHTGRVVLLSSVVGEMGNGGQVGYAATKAALLGVSKSIAREYASRNITVNAVAPGFIETEMTSSIEGAMREKLLESIPLQRIGAASEVAAAVAYLCSDEAAYVTGQTIRVNGGMYM